MSTDPRITILEGLPTEALLNIIRDYANDSIAMSGTLFAIGINPAFRQTEALDLLDLIFPILRSRAEKQVAINRQRNAASDAAIHANQPPAA